MGMWANCCVCVVSASTGQQAECCYTAGALGSLCEVIWLIKQRRTLKQSRPFCFWRACFDCCSVGAAGTPLASLSSARPWMTLGAPGWDFFPRRIVRYCCASLSLLRGATAQASRCGRGGRAACPACGRQPGWAHPWRRLQLHCRRRAARFVTPARGLQPTDPAGGFWGWRCSRKLWQQLTTGSLPSPRRLLSGPLFPMGRGPVCPGHPPALSSRGRDQVSSPGWSLVRVCVNTCAMCLEPWWLARVLLACDSIIFLAPALSSRAAGALCLCQAFRASGEFGGWQHAEDYGSNFIRRKILRGGFVLRDWRWFKFYVSLLSKEERCGDD